MLERYKDANIYAIVVVIEFSIVEVMRSIFFCITFGSIFKEQRFSNIFIIFVSNKDFCKAH